MAEILIFGGTTEGRRLSESLSSSGIANTVCVATDYGEKMMDEYPLTTVLCGRMDAGEIGELLDKGGFSAVVDATHPYAVEITKNISEAVKDSGIPLLLLEREPGNKAENSGRTRFFRTNEECAAALAETGGNILLTIGSKGLPSYCLSEDMKKRLFVRVLPDVESISICAGQGIDPRHIIAIQGPFSVEMNEALCRGYSIDIIVTKDSGRTGGYDQKLKAAENLGLKVFVIGRPKGKNNGDTAGLSFGEVLKKLENITGRRIAAPKLYDISLVGAGMGSHGCLTAEAAQEIERADIILGSERIISGFTPRITKKPLYTENEIIKYLENAQSEPWDNSTRRVAVLFSGDTGFYSGCQRIYTALLREISEGRLNAAVKIIPGISCVSYLAAKSGKSIQDSAVISLHGRKNADPVKTIAGREKTFILTSGVEDVRRLGKLMIEAGLDDSVVVAGFNLSYPDESVEELSPRECINAGREGLYTCLVINPKANGGRASHGLPDSAFLRGKVPMTKEEIRDVCLAKLGLKRNSVLYDIGSGTGSIAVEAALLSDDITVYAVEKNVEAIGLIRQNMEKHHLSNINIIEGEAPEALTELPPPTHVFIGGGGGRLRDILRLLSGLDSKIRTVMTAVTLDTLGEIDSIRSEFDIDLVQIQVSRGTKAGRYTMMKAENPVWICSFDIGADNGGDRCE